MIHNLDFCFELLGSPLEVSAKGFEKQNSHVYATFAYKDAVAMIEATTLLPLSAPFQIGFNLIFEKGSIHFSGEYGQTAVEKMTLFTSEKIVEVGIPGKNEYEVLMKEMINSLENDIYIPSLSLESAGKAIMIADKVMASIPMIYT
jgi:predicted dehydrogenase